MYKRGELQIRDTYDSRTDDYVDGTYACLPHSCGSWVIGGKQEMLLLIADLDQAIEEFDTKKSKESKNGNEA